ncbi:major capsid protein [Microviridae sp.]|nr:major capsid protein [Microviridae sp.]
MQTKARQTSRPSHQFSQVPKAEIQRSRFDRSHGLKTTFDAGHLIPIFVDEALPGDTFTLKLNAFSRLATPIKPIMDNLYMDTFFFAVPYRLLWDNWQRFNGEQTSPGDSTDYVVPQIVSPIGGYLANTLADYMGLPTGVAGFSHSALPLRAYNLIWNEWFRDQNLQSPETVPTTDGPDLDTLYALKKRGKRHDYFTSCLPWPQKGTEVVIPLAQTAPILRTPNATAWDVYATGTDTKTGDSALQSSATGQLYATTSLQPVSLDPVGGLYTDLTGATATTINALREAFQVQRLYERDARGGTRYTEILRAHFGVTSPDARLQRPEYLGGGSSPITVTPIAQTSGSADAGGYTTTPQGNLSALGTTQISGHGFSKSFTEHCIIIGLVSVRADLTYQQGLNKMWSRQTRFDFYWPALSHLGEQAVLNKEIYLDGTAADEQPFGYQERYAEYRYKPSLVTGEFRSSFAQSLDIWHLAQDFASLPLLNGTFIVENPPVDRVIAVTDEPHFLFDSWFQLNCARPMPLYGVPGMIDHF